MSRFDGIAFNEQSKTWSSELKKSFEKLEEQIDNYLLDSRSKSVAITHLEDAFMWINKAIKDQQIKSEGDPALQQERAEN